MQTEGARVAALRLEAVLDGIHTDLMAGRLGGLEGRAAEVEALAEGIAGLRDRALARRLQAKARRNETCLAASARGVRAARQRLAEVLAVRAGLSTYDGTGRRAATGPSGEKLARRF